MAEFHVQSYIQGSTACTYLYATIADHTKVKVAGSAA